MAHTFLNGLHLFGLFSLEILIFSVNYYRIAAALTVEEVRKTFLRLRSESIGTILLQRVE